MIEWGKGIIFSRVNVYMSGNKSLSTYFIVYRYNKLVSTKNTFVLLLNPLSVLLLNSIKRNYNEVIECEVLA